MLMKRLLVLLLIAGLMTIFAGCDSKKSASAPAGPMTVNMQEGDWELNMVTKMSGIAGMPEHNMPFSMKVCVTKEDVATSNSDLSNQKGCKAVTQKMDGNTFIWEGRCEENGAISEVNGKMTYSGTAYSGEMLMTAKQKDGQVLKTSTTITGRRIGDCTPASLAERDRMKKMAQGMKNK
jgi:hypothetical protein